MKEDLVNENLVTWPEFMVQTVLTASLSIIAVLVITKLWDWYTRRRRAAAFRSVGALWNQGATQRLGMRYSDWLRDMAFKLGDEELLFRAGVLHYLDAIMRHRTDAGFGIYPDAVEKLFGKGVPGEERDSLGRLPYQDGYDKSTRGQWESSS